MLEWIYVGEQNLALFRAAVHAIAADMVRSGARDPQLSPSYGLALVAHTNYEAAIDELERVARADDRATPHGGYWT